MAATSWQGLCARAVPGTDPQRSIPPGTAGESPGNGPRAAALPAEPPPARSPAEVPHPCDPKTRSQGKGNLCRPAGTQRFLLGQRERCSEPAPSSQGSENKGVCSRVPGDGAQLPPAASAGSASGAGDAPG